MTWQEQALCVGLEELFFADMTDMHVATLLEQERDALRICRACPVRTECRNYAEQLPDPVGVWGGVNYDRTGRFATTFKRVHPCRVAGCTRPPVGRGFCKHHYKKPKPGRNPKLTAEDLKTVEGMTHHAASKVLGVNHQTVKAARERLAVDGQDAWGSVSGPSTATTVKEAS